VDSSRFWSLLQEEFLGKLKAIKGISTVETQTYTLEEVVGSLEELHS
jgi:hypothetical protein